MAEDKSSDTRRNEIAEKENESGKDSYSGIPVVGIGASAGGLEAISVLLESMPEDTDAAFVIVQHLAPYKDSALPELLARYTRMPVSQVTDEMEIRPNMVYVIPPEKNMSVMNGKLQLLDQVKSASPRHPIDFFFKSMASELGRYAVCIIMSGTGTDGTEGARMIKAELGLVIAQDPAEAKYDGMPSSVIESGLADYVLKAAEIAGRVTGYLKQIPVRPGQESADDLAGALPKILALIRNETSNDFSAYKESTLLRRIAKRMSIHNIYDPSQYLHFMQENPKEITTLFKELLINVTSFFRDKDAFDKLKTVLKPVLERKNRNEEIRVWVVGCSTGEEAYSIAITIRELLDELGMNNKVQIFATDLDSDAIEIARNAVYHKNITEDVTPERLKRFFTIRDDVYQVIPSIREMLVFATHNIIREPPFLRMDLISVRNLLIYLKGELQKRIIPLFHYSMRENAILFLSPSETIGEFTGMFAEVDRKWKIYRSVQSHGLTGRILSFPPVQHITEARRAAYKERAENEISEATDGIILRDYTPPYVVIDGADNVIFFRGNMDKFLRLPEGKVTMNIVDLARRGLASHLDIVIRSARRQKAEARRHGITFQNSPDSFALDILARPVSLKSATESMMVIFLERQRQKSEAAENGAGDKKSKKDRKSTEKDHLIAELEHELKRSREDLQASMEEMETSNEELKSTNEELLSSNEELQSANEELETSREELRSVNEELSGLNEEKQERIEQLNSARDDMRNLLDTIDVATVFLDLDLNIKSFTPALARLFSIRKSDIGRPLSEISTSLEYAGLFDDIHAVLRDVRVVEKEVKSKDYRWYMARILPYRSRDNEMRGVLLIFFDIDSNRVTGAALQYMQAIVDTVREPMLVLDKELCVQYANHSFYAVFRVNENDTVDQYVYDLGNGQWNIPELKHLLEDIIPKNSFFNNYPVENEFPHIGLRRMLLNARRMQDSTGIRRILLAIEDITERPYAERLFPDIPGKENES